MIQLPHGMHRQNTETFPTALFITPVVVLLGWILNKDMSLYFSLFETISLFVSAFIVNFLVLDGRSNYLEGALLCAAYIIIAWGFTLV